jgi:RecA/RadA recombinase
MDCLDTQCDVQKQIFADVAEGREGSGPL